MLYTQRCIEEKERVKSQLSKAIDRRDFNSHEHYFSITFYLNTIFRTFDNIDGMGIHILHFEFVLENIKTNLTTKNMNL